jgi:hypothetical protein
MQVKSTLGDSACLQADSSNQKQQQQQHSEQRLFITSQLRGSGGAHVTQSMASNWCAPRQLRFRGIVN